MEKEAAVSEGTAVEEDPAATITEGDGTGEMALRQGTERPTEAAFDRSVDKTALKPDENLSNPEEQAMQEPQESGEPVDSTEGGAAAPPRVPDYSDRGKHPSTLLRENTELASTIAAEYQNVSGVEPEAVTDQVNLALRKSAQEYDPESGIRFSTFADQAIRNELNTLYRPPRSGSSTPYADDPYTKLTEVHNGLLQLQKDGVTLTERQQKLLEYVASELAVRPKPVDPKIANPWFVEEPPSKIQTAQRKQNSGTWQKQFERTEFPPRCTWRQVSDGRTGGKTKGRKGAKR